MLKRLHADSSYAFIEGCDSSKGCAVFLRGDNRSVLTKMQRLIRTSVLLAYHLRLEKAFYYDRCVLLWDHTTVDTNSDDETSLKLTNSPLEERLLLSSSLDIDYIAPVPGISVLGAVEEEGPSDVSRLSVALSTANMCFTRLKMGEGGQRYVTEHKHLTFYGLGDVCLGQYLIDNCFLPFGTSGTSSSSYYSRGFVHNPGRIDVQVLTSPGERFNPIPPHLIYSLPITVNSFCKACKCRVTPESVLSDESWSMSFGKLIDVLLYNRTAQGSPFGCNHSCRENHLVFFCWAGLTVKMEFIPIHPFSIKVRDQLPLPERFHELQTRGAIELLLLKSNEIFEEFRSAVKRAEAVVNQEILVSDKYPEDLGLELLESVKALDLEQSSAMDIFQDSLRSSLEALGELNEQPIYFHFPMGWKRDLCILCDGWNAQLEIIANRFAELRLKGEQYSLFKSRVGNEDRHLSSQPSSYSESALLGEGDSIRDKTNSDYSIHNDPDAELKPADSDKQSSISMVLALLVGSETREKRRRIHLGDVADPSLRMLPGRRGEVILVNPDEPSSVVAYSLASKEYFDQLQMLRASMQENDESHLIYSRSEDFLLGRISPGLSKSEELRCGKSDVSVHDQGSDANETQADEETEVNDVLVPELRGADVSDPRCYRPLPVLNKGVTAHGVPVNIAEELESDFYADSRLIEASSFEISMEKLMILPRKSHIKHYFEDAGDDSKTHKYYCYSFWSTQFDALRRIYFADDSDEGYIQSLASSVQWITQGGKSGASFAKSIDGRFVMKVISRTELLMFNDFAPAYFEYMSKALFHELPSSLCKVILTLRTDDYS